MDQMIYGILNNIPTIALVGVIAISLYVLGKGADMLVDEAIGLSARWGIPKVIVGATIVSLGTTIPEVTVSVMAALKGNPDMALGNAIGSIITNTALILGLCSLIGHLPVNRKLAGRQGVIQIALAVLLSVLSLPIFSNTGEGKITQAMGFLFVGILIFYIVISIRAAKGSEIKEEADNLKPLHMQALIMILGLFLVILSSKTLIPSVEIVAIRVGIPQSVVAATLVAFGTSLPELITSITAVRKGHGELAVGNIAGANILNILFVIGLSAAVTPAGLSVPVIFYKLQIPTMLIALVLFFISSRSKDEKINKLEGSALLGLYVIYLILNYTGI